MKLHYLSADGEEGFPGNLDIHVTYTLSNQNEFIITYHATTDKTTLVNLTHHGFFSLSGIANPTATVDNNIVTINADFYTPIDNVSIPTGEIAKVEGTPMDFRTPQRVDSRINDPFEQLKFGAGYDHCYVLNKREAGTLSLQQNVWSPKAVVAWKYTLQSPVYKFILQTGTMVSKVLMEQLSQQEVPSVLKHNIFLIRPIKAISLLVFYIRGKLTVK